MANSDSSLDPDVEYSLLSGQDKAALLLSSLGVATTQLIFKNMRDNDVKRMVNAMANVKQAQIWLIKRLLEEFYSALNEDNALLFSDNNLFLLLGKRTNLSTELKEVKESNDAVLLLSGASNPQ